MTLLTRLNSLPNLRLTDFPYSLRNICLILWQEHLEFVETIMSSRPNTRLEAIVLMDYSPSSPKSLRITVAGDLREIPVAGLRELVDMPHLARVFFFDPEDPFGSAITELTRKMTPYGINSFYLCLTQPLNYYCAMHIPNFYADNADALENIYAGLADDASRTVYAARIKAMLTGDAGYLPISAHPEYHHPLVKPEAGDIMIDGGLSDMVEAQKKFSRSVGPNGRVFGFEPVPDMCESARNTLATCGNYHVFRLGLGEKDEKVHFEMLRDSSHVGEAGENTVECELTSIDSFMAKSKIGRLDCVKMDIEGSELAALKGAANTIRKFRPKLIICLYHKPGDVLDIPSYIKELVPEYELYIAHSTFHFLDTVLYARVPE